MTLRVAELMAIVVGLFGLAGGELFAADQTANGGRGGLQAGWALRKLFVRTKYNSCGFPADLRSSFCKPPTTEHQAARRIAARCCLRRLRRSDFERRCGWSFSSSLLLSSARG